MNNAQLVEQLAEKHGLNKADAKLVVADVFEAIVAAAKSGSDVSIQGFGKFTVKHRAARQGRNPQTGEPVAIAASNALGFSPAKAVKDALNG